MKELSTFTNLFDDSLFRDFFSARSGGDRLPAIDIHEEEKSYCVTADLPGVSKDDIKVSLDNGILSITAETHSEKKQEKAGKVIRQERHEGRYSRSFSVGNAVDASAIKAKFDNGVLTIELPKMAPQGDKSSKIKID